MAKRASSRPTFASTFLTLEARGALPRLVPVPESVESAWLGVTTTLRDGQDTHRRGTR